MPTENTEHVSVMLFLWVIQHSLSPAISLVGSGSVFSSTAGFSSMGARNFGGSALKGETEDMLIPGHSYMELIGTCLNTAPSSIL